MILQIQKPKTTSKKLVLAQNTIIKKPTDAITSTISPTQTPTITPTLSLIPQFSPTPTPIPINVNNKPPSAGYTVQQVQTDAGVFNVNIVSADLNSTRVIVDTASDSDCANNCPVLSVSDYVSRNGAYAGINGTFFCPPEYSNCADKQILLTLCL